MAARIPKMIRVAVTSGDAISSCKTSGKSNTGTYFISSLKDYDLFAEYLDFSVNSYFLSAKKVDEYRILFKNKYWQNREKYSDQMGNFDKFCDFLVKNGGHQIDFDNRNNDQRVFLKFQNNLEPVADAIRHILYAELSDLVIEENGEHSYLVYPALKE